MKKTANRLMLLILTLALVLVAVSGCTSTKKQTIKLGAMSTWEPFTTILKDELIKKGYKAELVLFDANNMGAIATKDGSMDGFIHNHLPWIKTFNTENKSDLRMIEPYICYSRSALYSVKHESVASLPNKAIIAIPNDPTNVEKSLLMLQKLGLLTLGEKTGAFLTKLDITANPKNIQLLETEISTTARSINDADAVITSATRIKAAGLDPNKFLAEDEAAINYPLGLVVAPSSIDKQWVKDAMAIIESDAMRAEFERIYAGTMVRFTKK